MKRENAKVELRDGGPIYVFWENHFLHWLEALSLVDSISSGFSANTKLLRQVLVSCSLDKKSRKY